VAIVAIPDENKVLREENEVRDYLRQIHIDYERWDTSRTPADTPAEAVLAAYAPEIAALKAEGGYTTADIVDVTPDTPNLDTMLAKFSREHWHDEDEVRITLRGRGIFHIHPVGRPVVAVEVSEGDMIRVPRGTHHWFDLCSDRTIRAIRLFQDTAGWTPYYTGTGVDAGYEPVCFGPVYLNHTMPAVRG
jgi:1,2-dihydroxy-3-keto-5-methylthiopentene dioxygenase